VRDDQHRAIQPAPDRSEHNLPGRARQAGYHLFAHAAANAVHHQPDIRIGGESLDQSFQLVAPAFHVNRVRLQFPGSSNRKRASAHFAEAVSGEDNLKAGWPPVIVRPPA